MIRNKIFTPATLRVASVAALLAVTAAFAAILFSMPPSSGTVVRGQGGATPTDMGIATATSVVNRIVPNVEKVTVRTESKVRLSVNFYGIQDIMDNDLEVRVCWSATGGTFTGLDDQGCGGRGVVYTAPEEPGTYTVTAESNPTATFTITVRRSAPAGITSVGTGTGAGSVVIPTVTPRNPSGPIPSILSDSAGTQYSVFTPEQGGSFVGEDGITISAGAGSVPNGEYIGISASGSGSASNQGVTTQRYTLSGTQFDIDLIDSSGSDISSYRLNTPAEVCAPMPTMFRGNISELSMVTVNDNDSLTIVNSVLKFQGDVNRVCGNVSLLPATVAVGVRGAPEPLPTATPLPAPKTPDTGGYSPSSTNMIWVLILGITTIAVGGAMLLARRRRNDNSNTTLPKDTAGST